MWYLRLYIPRGKPNYEEWVMNDQALFQKIKHHDKIDVVSMTTGEVMRHDYKKPFPNWINDPLVRAMVLTTGKIPSKAP